MSETPPKPDLPPHPALAALRTHRNFYGRVHGKTMRPAQKGYLVEDLARLRLRGVSIDENPSRVMLDPGQVPGAGPLWLEIGFGGGEHMVAVAAANPGVRLIGCEPFVNGVAMALGLLRATPCANLLLHPGDVRDLFDVLPGGVLKRVFLNYPDPWPKSRHHRRRFVTQEHLVPLFAACAPGARFHLATDIADYARQAREEAPRAGFVPLSDSAEPWADWVSTRYEKKALREGRVPQYLTWVRP